MGFRSVGQGDCKRKKLIEVGYVYAKGNGGDDGLAEDAKWMNLPADWDDLYKVPDMFVHYECWDAWLLFQMCVTQWRISPMGQRTGLDYTAVICVAQFLGYDTDVFQQIRYLELGAMTAFSGGKLSEVLGG